VQEKIEYVFKIIRTVNRIPQKFVKHIESTDGLYEMRIKSGNSIYSSTFANFNKLNYIYNLSKKATIYFINKLDRSLKQIQTYPESSI